MLNEANLQNADLSGVNLSGAQMRGVDLARANLSSAKLTGTNLSEANLIGTNLSGIEELNRANLTSAVFDDTTLWPNGFDPTEAGASQNR